VETRAAVEPLGVLLFSHDESKDVVLLLAKGERLKVHKLLLCVYSSVYKQRYAEGSAWGAGHELDLTSDSKGAWELLLGLMYEQETSREFLHEAACIANRDNMVPFNDRLWSEISETIAKANVLCILQMAWANRGDSECVYSCLFECFAFIFKHMPTMGSEWLVEYTACLQADPELGTYADAHRPLKRKKKHSA
jgi:hypothetical protein